MRGKNILNLLEVNSETADAKKSRRNLVSTIGVPTMITQEAGKPRWSLIGQTSATLDIAARIAVQKLSEIAILMKSLARK
jgi:hypothetical protein